MNNIQSNDRRRFILASSTILATALAPNATAAPFNQQRLDETAVKIERAFTAVDYGQLHYRVATPKDPTLNNHRPVVCFHQTPNSSQVFIEFMAQLAQDRVVYAIDTPGLGESDLPNSPPEVQDYAKAMSEFLHTHKLNDVDLVGYHTGASIAVELANMEPKRINKMMLVGLALFNQKERKDFFERPWPAPREEGGQHLITEWQRSHKWRGAGQSDASVERTFVEKISAGQTAWWGARAVMRHDLKAALIKNKTPALVINSKDDLFNVTPRVKEFKPDLELVTDAKHGFGIFEAQAKEMAQHARNFFLDKRAL